MSSYDYSIPAGKVRAKHEYWIAELIEIVQGESAFEHFSQR